LRDGAILVTTFVLVIGAQRGIEQVLAVGDTHIELLRRIQAVPKEHPDEQILPASWDLGYMIGVASGRRPAAHPQAINVSPTLDGENDARIFWSPESAAAAEADRRGIRFLVIGERDFTIIEERPSEDRFRSRRRMGFQVPTMSSGGKRGPLPLSIVRQLLVYHAQHDTKRMKAWRLFAEARDPRTDELVRVLELVEPPDPGRTFVFAIFENPTPQLQETQVQLSFDIEGGGGKQGARLTSRLRPGTSSLSIFSYIGVDEGKGRAELSNPATAVRLVSHQSGGRYAVDFVRPRPGWRPLEIR
jgi:hypothetical protein